MCFYYFSVQTSPGSGRRGCVLPLLVVRRGHRPTERAARLSFLGRPAAAAPAERGGGGVEGEHEGEADEQRGEQLELRAEQRDVELEGGLVRVRVRV